MLRVRNLSKKVDDLLTVDNITFSIGEGEILGILGPANSGKSIAIKMITGLIQSTSGFIELDDVDLASDQLIAKELMGYVPDGTPFYPEMKVIDFLNFIAEIRGFFGEEKNERVGNVIKNTHLEESINLRIADLPIGAKRKLSISQALMHDPKILVLDEPTGGLDPNQKYEIRKLLKDLSKEKSIILATRAIGDIEALCDRVAVMARGKLIIESTPESLAQQSPFHNTLQLRVAKSEISENMIEALQTIQDILRVERVDGKRDEINLRLYPRDKYISLPRIHQLAKDLGWEILDLQTVSGCLDEVFRTITTRYQQVG